MKSPSLLHLTCRILAGLTLASTLTGCAADIMRSYLGRAPEDVMAKYGPPFDVRDLPDGRRSYQWLETSMTTSGGAAATELDRHGRPRSHTEYSPTTTEERRCFYTMYARRTPAGWRIDSFVNPVFGC